MPHGCTSMLPERAAMLRQKVLVAGSRMMDRGGRVLRKLLQAR